MTAGAPRMHRLPDADLHTDGPGWQAWRAGPKPGSVMRVQTAGSVLWFVVCPNGAHGTLSPRNHSVVEHDDGTITVQPSIVAPGWHGFLERGIWRLA